jgi:Protein of unknown function (DUF3237)
MAPTLEKAFTLTVYLSKADILPFGPIKGGPHRYAIPFSHGTLSGSGITATILQGGSDWILLDTSTGVAHLDIRTHGRTDSGDHIYVHYPGILKMDAATQKALEWSPEAKTTRSEDHYWMTSPIFEVSNEAHKWMEQTAFVGHGHWHIPGDGSQAVEYEIYKVLSG